jgi:uncharacterized membrane protein
MFGLTIAQVIMVLILVIFTLVPIFLLPFAKHFRDRDEDDSSSK